MKIIRKYSGTNSKGYQIKTDLCHNFYVYRYGQKLFEAITVEACRAAVRIFTDKRIKSMEP